MDILDRIKKRLYSIQGFKKIMNKQLQGAISFYEKNRMSNIESVSGTGSFLKNAQEAIYFVPRVIRKLEARTVTDCPCGDWNWMSKVDLDGVDYLGLDIIEDIIERNKKRYAKQQNRVLSEPIDDNYTSKYKPELDIKFDVFNILESVPRTSDLIICRDFMFHLTLDQQAVAMDNFRKSKSKYIMMTTYPYMDVNKELTDKEIKDGWGFRKINVERPPFNLQDPICFIEENRACSRRHLRVYKLCQQ